MPSPRSKISNLPSRIGLRDFCPPHYRAHPQVWDQTEGLKRGVKDIVDSHYRLSIPHIKKSTTLRDSAITLLSLYGGDLWCDEEPRPWLFRPGEGTEGADEVYTKDLYFSDAQDRRFIQETFYRYVFERTLRYHKDHPEGPPATPHPRPMSRDGSYEPTPLHGAETTFSPINAQRTGGFASPDVGTVTGPRSVVSLDTAWKKTIRSPSLDSLRDATPRRSVIAEDNDNPAGGPASRREGQFLMEQFDDSAQPCSATERRHLQAEPNSCPSGQTSLRPIQFKVWFTFNGPAGPARRVVNLDTSMSFRQAFSYIKEKLQRKLKGGDLLAIVFKLDEKTSLEVDEEDTWRELLAMVNKAGHRELGGTVDM